jgi:oligoribonuclease NrnB/cAMP/cGMP phosphodiesterase (DHH superfamily)
MIGIDYGDDFPWDRIAPRETVYMVDFSLQPWDDMVRLSEMCRLIWIDHHKSAIDNQHSYPIRCRGRWTVGIGACALVWRWLAEAEQHPDFVDSAPQAVRLLAKYDVWDHSDHKCLPFQYGMRLRNTMPGEPIWDTVLTGPQEAFIDLINEGETVMEYQRQQDAIRAKAMCFETELDGLRCIAANHGLGNSKLFDTVWDPERYDAMLTFNWRKSRWTVSLYSDKPDIDVSLVAKAHGGGGHKGAAGFQCAELPFELR